MNDEDSIKEKVGQPAGSGLGCMAAFIFCCGGTILGAVAGEWIYAMSQAGGPDEGGSMGIILPSSEMLAGAFWGGLAGLLLYWIVRAISQASQRKRL